MAEREVNNMKIKCVYIIIIMALIITIESAYIAVPHFLSNNKTNIGTDESQNTSSEISESTLQGIYKGITDDMEIDEEWTIDITNKETISEKAAVAITSALLGTKNSYYNSFTEWEPRNKEIYIVLRTNEDTTGNGIYFIIDKKTGGILKILEEIE